MTKHEIVSETHWIEALRALLAEEKAAWPGPCHPDRRAQTVRIGATVLHIAEQSEALMPSDANGRARTRAWMFAALNSVEPPIQNLAGIDLFHAGEAWALARRADGGGGGAEAACGAQGLGSAVAIISKTGSRRGIC
jgi:hypothetical protein